MSIKESRIQPRALLISWLSAVIVLLIGTGILTLLISGNIISDDSAGYGVSLIVLLASMIGTGVMISAGNSKGLLAGTAVTVMIWLTMLAINALFFQGEYKGVAVTLLLIAGGSFATVLLGIKKGKERIKPRKYRHNS